MCACLAWGTLPGFSLCAPLLRPMSHPNRMRQLCVVSHDEILHFACRLVQDDCAFVASSLSF
jgi:hypothetical protein